MIRPATIDDLPQILRFRRAMLSETGSAGESSLDRMQDSAAAFLRAGFRDGSCIVWMAETEGGSPVGCGILHIVPWIPSAGDPSQRRVWVHNVYTEPEFRRRGIAGEIIQAMLEWCRTNGFQSVSLHASEQGRRLYESLGFRASNEMRLFF